MNPTHVVDFRGDALSGATAAAVEHFEAALAYFQSWRGDPKLHVAAALEEAPAFVMAHVLDAYVQICSRDPAAPKVAHCVYLRAAGLPANPRESLHLAAIAAIARDDYEAAKLILMKLLAEFPRDVLALQGVHAFDYLTGDAARMVEHVPRVTHAWAEYLPGYHALLSMQAFAHAECGEYACAEDLALQALELNPLDARAHHAMAHVFEMSGRANEGIGWLRKYEAAWSTTTAVATHCWWHVALLHLQQEDTARALAIYDTHVRGQRSTAIPDLIDASSLLWRLLLCNRRVPNRWTELAACWAPHIEDGFCTFSDLHAMLAFVGAREWSLARSLVHALSKRQLAPTRHGQMSQVVGLPACRALLAFGQSDYTTAARLLGELPAIAHRLGGSHAQREVLHLTLLEAAQRTRRPLQAVRAAASLNYAKTRVRVFSTYQTENQL